MVCRIGRHSNDYRNECFVMPFTSSVVLPTGCPKWSPLADCHRAQNVRSTGNKSHSHGTRFGIENQILLTIHDIRDRGSKVWSVALGGA